MTTLVAVTPHPAAGLKVRVEIQHKGGGKNTVDFLKAGDMPRQFAATDDMTIVVSEEKDEPMVEAPGNELRGPGEI